MRFFLVERKKVRATTFYVIGVRQAIVAADVFTQQEAECMPGDVLRVTELGVAVLATLSKKRDWETHDYETRSGC